VRACEKMRKQKTLAQAIHVYIRTNPFSSKPQYCGAGSISFAAPTDNVVEIIKSALKILEQIYQKNYEYKKAGIMLLDLVKQGENEQINLFQNDLLSNQNVKNFDNKKSEIIQKTLEKINQNFSKNTIFYAIQGTKRSWQMLCNKRSQHYTTNIKEIAKVY
jgi:DNA polymerase V